MSAAIAPTQVVVRNRLLRVHRWIGVCLAVLVLTVALTGVLISFHFEIEDALLAGEHQPTDFDKIESRIEELTSTLPGARVNWIWTTAGLPDRYVIDYTTPDNNNFKLYVDGAGAVLGERAADDPGFLGLMLNIHQNLLADRSGHWILAGTGLLLLSNLVLGLVIARPRGGQWRKALSPVWRTSNPSARYYALHRAISLWGVLPAIVVIGAGTMILFEDQVRQLVDAPEIVLPANPPRGRPVGFAMAARAAEAAIKDSTFVGTTFPEPRDASFYAWLRAPGSMYRNGGYGGSLVVVDANNAGVRAALPLTESEAGYALVGSLYPLHTGEILGLPGRLLTFTVGIWLTVTTLMGALLWWHRGPGRKKTGDT